MNNNVFEAIPLWLFFVVTVAFILLSVEVGFRAGSFHAASQRRHGRPALTP
jgi:hypothetical protein